MFENDFITSETFEDARKYWEKKLSGELTETRLFNDFIIANTYDKKYHKFTLAGNLSAQLLKISQNTDLSLYVILLTVFKILYNNFSNQQDIIVCSPTLKDSSQDFNRFIILRDFLDPGLTFKQFLLEVRQTVIAGYKNQFYPLRKLEKLLKIEESFSLYRVIILLENIHSQEFIDGIIEKNKNDVIFAFTGDNDRIDGTIIYNSNLFDESTIKRIREIYVNILGILLADPDNKLNALDIISREEKEYILYELNDTQNTSRCNLPIHELFSQSVMKFLDNTALVDYCFTPGTQNLLSYNMLDKESDRFACYLKTLGVENGTVVGLMVRRSAEMIIGMLAILKANGCYLPIDAEYPAKRIEYIIKDSNISLFITEESLVDKIKKIDFQGNIIDIYDRKNYRENKMNAGNKNLSAADRAAYIMYTSGSTGAPKGVIVAHHNVARLVTNVNFFDLRAGEHFLLTGSISFDISTFEIWGTLMNGLNLYLVEDHSIYNPDNLSNIISMYCISAIHLIPHFFTQLVNKKPGIFSLIKCLMIGGDIVKPGDINNLRKKNKDLEILHMYGPTENTTFSTFLRVEQEYPLNLPIGKPVSNSTAYIVNKNGKLQSRGVRGEIWVSGAGIARGYLNMLESTKEKFIIDPFVPAQVVYKTGDLGRFLPDGNIEFLGREDFQVKINGIRIELGEIERCILNYTGIKEAAVVLKNGREELLHKEEKKYLCAYFVSDRTINVHELKEYLFNELPRHMIPHYFIALEEMPLNLHGKISVERLPHPEEVDMSSESKEEKPTDDLGGKMVEIWKDVLDREKIGIHDDYFKIGGDSIKAIQIASRMFKYGYKFSVRDIFQNPTISKLMKVVKTTNKNIDRKVTAGKFLLSPVQKRFFEKQPVNVDHYNNAMMITLDKTIGEAAVKSIFKKIQDHHDMLRATFKNEKGEYSQEIHDLDYPLSLSVYDLFNTKEQQDVLWQKANEIQAGFDIKTGPLMKLGLFRFEESNKLLIVVHHLIVDAVSWRILFDDFHILYRQYKNNQSLELPGKTDSYKSWIENLDSYSKDEFFLSQQIKYWNKFDDRELESLPYDDEAAPYLVKHSGEISFSLDKETTHSLLTKANEPFNTNAKELLLTALALCVKEIWGMKGLFIAIEDHGRHSLVEDIDLNRTIGWFTCSYPVFIDTAYNEELDMQIRETKELLRKVPHKGLGYGILKYLAAEDKKKGKFLKFEPQVCFNYLGQFDSNIKKLPYEISTENTGYNLSLDEKKDFPLEITGIIIDNRLQVNISYNKNQLKLQTMERLMKQYKSRLEQVIHYCSDKKERVLTPTDVTLLDLSVKTLDALAKKYDIKSIYPLSPMQEGMLFLAQNISDPHLHFEQLSFRIEEELNIEVIERTLDALFMRYDILRSAFVYEDLKHPFQIVLNNKKPRFYYEDISHSGEKSEREVFVKNFLNKDRQIAFDLVKGDSMRVSALKIDEAEYEFTWSHHHILMDGWCAAILISDFLEIYNSIIENKEYRLEDVIPYGKYLEWLEKQDKEKSRKFWEEYTADYTEPVGIPKKSIGASNKIGYSKKRVTVLIDMEQVNSLDELAAKYQVTLANIMQTTWGVLLSKFNAGKEDVLFGGVVSGRPADIEGIERMVGLCIDTIPIRIKFDMKSSFKDHVVRVKDDSLDCEPHSYYSLVDIQSGSLLKQDLFDNIMIIENYPIIEQIEGIKAEHQKKRSNFTFRFSNFDSFDQSNYDFNLLFTLGNPMNLFFDYNANVYEKAMIEAIAENFIYIVGEILKNEDYPISQLIALSLSERKKLLDEFNRQEQDFLNSDIAIIRSFEKFVDTTPDNAAVVHNDALITYKELDGKSNLVGKALQSKEIITNSITAIMLNRSIDLVVAMIGVLKAGGVYLLLDHQLPETRKKYILNDCRPSVLLTGNRLYAENDGLKESVLNENVVLIDNIRDSNDRVRPCNNKSDSLMYMIYTSGTTGNPKGVLIRESGFINLILSHREVFNEAKGVRISQVSSVNFDGLPTEVWPALFNGATIYIADDDVRSDPERLKEWLIKKRINITFQPTVIGQLLLKEEWPVSGVSLEVLRVGGERLSISPRETCPFKVYNLYGPTEDTTWTTWSEVDKSLDNDHSISIGKPIWNHKVYIIGENHELAPIGVAGELCVSGVGLAEGYLNMPKLTAEKFIANPFVKNEKLYCTGDIARWLTNGDIDFLGRKDFQVKIRGCRVEPGEIESILKKYSGVKDVVVLAKTAKNRQIYLCAYVVPGDEFTVVGTREYLAAKLPAYMIPDHFFQVEKIPLTINGKVDRNALEIYAKKFDYSVEVVKPGNEIEQKISKIWQDILNLPGIGIYDNFFDVGGNSINVFQLKKEIDKTFEINIPVEKIFEFPTINSLCLYIRTQKERTFSNRGNDNMDNMMKEGPGTFYQKIEKVTDKMQIIEKIKKGQKG